MSGAILCLSANETAFMKSADPKHDRSVLSVCLLGDHMWNMSWSLKIVLQQGYASYAQSFDFRLAMSRPNSIWYSVSHLMKCDRVGKFLPRRDSTLDSSGPCLHQKWRSLLNIVQQAVSYSILPGWESQSISLIILGQTATDQMKAKFQLLCSSLLMNYIIIYYRYMIHYYI